MEKTGRYCPSSIVSYIDITYPPIWCTKKYSPLYYICPKPIEVKLLSHVRIFATPWTVVYQAPPSMGFSRQGYWSGLPFPSPEDLPDPGMKPRSPALQAETLPSEPPGKYSSLHHIYSEGRYNQEFWMSMPKSLGYGREIAFLNIPNCC